MDLSTRIDLESGREDKALSIFANQQRYENTGFYFTFWSFVTRSHYVDQARLKFVILFLPLSAHAGVAGKCYHIHLEKLFNRINVALYQEKAPFKI